MSGEHWRTRKGQGREMDKEMDREMEENREDDGGGGEQ